MFCTICFTFCIKGYSLYNQNVINDNIDLIYKEISSGNQFVSFNEIDDEFINALLSSEDKRFYSHPGVDLKSIIRALITNLKYLDYKEGGSTITQQLAKNLYFTSEKKIERKVAELYVVYQLENNYTKDQILEMYLNIIYFGEGKYGLSDAVTYYFQEDPIDLSQVQINALVKTIKCPTYCNPNY